MLSLLSTWLGVIFLAQFNNLPGLQASTGVTHSYSSHPFLCVLAYVSTCLFSCSRWHTASWYCFLSWDIWNCSWLYSCLILIAVGKSPISCNYKIRKHTTQVIKSWDLMELFHALSQPLKIPRKKENIKWQWCSGFCDDLWNKILYCF